MVKTEGQHTGEYLISEGNGSISREVANINTGATVVDGQLIQLTGGNIAPLTNGTLAGIAYGGGTATLQRPKRIPYIARLAEVKYELLTFPEGSNKSELIASLATLGIIVRASDGITEAPTEAPTEPPTEPEPPTEDPSEEVSE
jgi:hypothetical protein